MKDPFVTYEIALKMKELGFGEGCLSCYLKDKTLVGDDYYTLKHLNYNKGNWDECPSAPLWQQAIDWLREKDQCITISRDFDEGKMLGWCAQLDNEDGYISLKNKPTYEQAREAAILKALELIK